jgi:hypothetical protein
MKNYYTWDHNLKDFIESGHYRTSDIEVHVRQLATLDHGGKRRKTKRKSKRKSKRKKSRRTF